MSIVEILFYAFSAVLIVAALGVITARNPVHCALFLVWAFFNSAVIWMLLEAEFLAIVLMLVYVGAVMVLFLFVVMMLDVNIAKMREGFTRYAPLGILIAVLVVVEIGSVVWVKSLGGDAPEAAASVASRVTAIRVPWASCCTRSICIHSSWRRCCCSSRSLRPSRSRCGIARG